MIVSWAVLTAIFVIGFGKMAANNPASASPQNDSKDIAFAETSNSILGASDVASHNSKSDCWTIMNNKAYDITKYIPLHPGGPGTITPYCGKDAAAAFAGLPHSQYAESLLASYYIGDIGKSIAPAKNTTGNAPDNALPDNSTSINPPETAADNPGRKISLSTYEVNRHNSASDCWMIVDNGIYDVTSYIPSHPGGAGAIVSYCGKDGTEAFAGLPHSQYAAIILASYYVADLDTATPSVPNPTNTTAPISLPQSSSTSFSTAEIGAHNSAGSCWIILSGKAYDLTTYLPYHPGGINTILPYCGGDAALAFSGHSQYASSLLPQYYVGNVGSPSVQNTINTTPVQPAPSAPNTTQPPAATNPAPNASRPPAHLYTPAEISAHNSASSCWIILNN